MQELVDAVNGVVWSQALIFLCLGVGLYFSLRTRFLQLRYLKQMVCLMVEGKADGQGVSSFQALSISLSGRVGTGNIAGVAAALSPSGGLYLPANVALIVAFNYLYTFLQLDPKDLSEQLKRQGASIPGIRPGRATAEFITKTLDRMSVLGEAGGARGTKVCQAAG